MIALVRFSYKLWAQNYKTEFSRYYVVLGTAIASSYEIYWRSKMRPASGNAFRSQVQAVQKWFTEWNECERTIALYSLLRQMTPIHARFLSVVMEHTFRDQAYRTQMYEEQANDKGNDCLWLNTNLVT